MRVVVVKTRAIIERGESCPGNEETKVSDQMLSHCVSYHVLLLLVVQDVLDHVASQFDVKQAISIVQK